MNVLLLFILLCPALAYAEGLNNPAQIRDGEVWSSASRLERIAQDYVKQHHLEFEFASAKPVFEIELRGNDSVANVWFSSSTGKSLLVEIKPSGEVVACGLHNPVVRFAAKPFLSARHD